MYIYIYIYNVSDDKAITIIGNHVNYNQPGNPEMR